MTPRTVRIGALRYKVHRLRLLPPPHVKSAGIIVFKHRSIFVTTHSFTGARWTAKQQRIVFWHEVVHGILHSMKRWALNDDEPFVHNFAILLEQAVRSAK
jgi:hypothetical protein